MENITSAQQQNFLPDEEGIDIKKYIFMVLGHWWWFGISIFVGLTIAYLINRYSQQVYSADCSIIVGEEKPGTGSVENILDELTKIRVSRRKAVVENEISILKSYKLARTAIEELDFGISYMAVGRRGFVQSSMYKNSPFVVEFDISKNNPINYPIYITILSADKYRLIINDRYNIDREMQFGEKFEHETFGFTMLLRDPKSFDAETMSGKKYFFYRNDINSLTKQYLSALMVEVNDEKGAVLTLTMQGFVPEQVADYLNKLSDVYLQTNLDEKNRISENTMRFIDEQLSGIVDSLEITGLKLQQFRSANKVIDLSKEGNFLYEQVQNLQSERAMLDMQSKYYQYLRDYISGKKEDNEVVAPSVVGIQDNLLNSLVEELNKLFSQKRQLSYSVSDNTPQLVLLNTQISNSRKSLQENLKSLVESNNIAIENLRGRINKIDLEVQKLPGTEKQMIDIQRKFKINDQIYTFLLQKRAEAGINKASNTSDHRILDIAMPENAVKVKPKSSMNYMMGFMAGAAIPLALLLLLDFFNNKITDRKYLENHIKVPIIGNIGHNDISSEIPVSDNPKSGMAEAFRAIRSNLHFILKNPQAKVIAISSAVSGEGKTFFSVNLATILAMAGKITLIISLDLRRPKVHRIFGMENEEGISTYLIGKTKYNDIIKETEIENLYIAPAGAVPPNPAELIATDKMGEFMKKACEGFDYVIIDTPPVGIVTDALSLKDYIDAFVFVIRHNYSDRHVIEMINNLQKRNIFKNVCVVVNDIQLKGYYGYTYKYGYQYGYGYSSQFNQYEDYIKNSPAEKLLLTIRKTFKKRDK